MVELPELMRRNIDFVVAASAHRWAAERMRAKLATDPGFIEAEADRVVLHDFGVIQSPGSDARMDHDDEHMEVQQRKQAHEDCSERLRRFESDMWGLGISGLFHQWERDTKGVVLAFSSKSRKQVEQKDFPKLCDLLMNVGFDIRKCCAAFAALDTAHMISNVVKHGGGPSFRRLIDGHPELVTSFKPSRRKKVPSADDLRFTVRQFDAAAAAIGQIWRAFEKAKPPAPPMLRPSASDSGSSNRPRHTGRRLGE